MDYGANILMLGGRLLFVGLLAGLFASGLSGCSSLPAQSLTKQDQQQLVHESLSGIAALGRPYQLNELPAVDILFINPEMTQFIDRYVRPHRTKTAKLVNLVQALLTPGMLGVRYSEEHTVSASEAFHKRQANCLAFSNLFVAMARASGLKASFQDVLVAPEWDLNDDSMTLRRHVNVLVHGRRRHDKVVDISRNRRDLIQLEATQLTDKQAFAQFYNNKAIDFLRSEDYQQAFLWVIKALQMDPKAAFIWSNLGVVLGRLDKPEHAEAVLLKAASVDPSEQAVLANLASLYGATGNDDLAQHYALLVKRYRDSNPYYLLMAAREAYQEEDFDATLLTLRKAIKIKPEEPMLHELASRSYQQLGDDGQAVKSLQRAIEQMPDSARRADYQRRLDDIQFNSDKDQLTE